MPTQMEEKARLMKVPFLSDISIKKKKKLYNSGDYNVKIKKKKEASRKVKKKKSKGRGALYTV